MPMTNRVVLTCRIALAMATAVQVSATAQVATQTLPLIATHDNLRSAGILEDGVLSASFWAGVGEWYPEGEGSRSRPVEALGEEGKPLSIPSPLLRAPAGTTIRLSIRNTLTSPLLIHGLCDKPGTCEPVTISPGTTQEVRFALNAAGTFHYWATTSGRPLSQRNGRDSQLGGAIVSDSAGADVRDRIFVIGLIDDSVDSLTSELTSINGRSWPHTERLTYAVGDTAVWRLINLTPVPHAMHLHGFYFRVESVGDGMHDTRYSDAERRLAVTEQMLPGRTASLSWVPEREGNWLFHCHMLVHMMQAEHLHGGKASGRHAPDGFAAGMAGLVLGIEVTGGGPPNAASDVARRKLRLVIEPDDRNGAGLSYKVDLEEVGHAALRVNDRSVPGPILVLTRGEPVAVEVVNRLNEPTAIHWHGIELESFNDGVPGFSRTGGSVTPPVAPGGSFTANFTPSRAGTFIYHTHWHNADQLAAGIYGPLVVLEPGEVFDPVSDHLIVLGLDGPYRPQPNEAFVVNGDAVPRPLDLKAGISHRLRFINITADNVALTVQMLSGFDPITWTLVGKDGAETPSSQRTARSARQVVSVGETYDFEIEPMTPTPIGLWMELRRGNGKLLFQWPVRVQ